MENPLLRRRVRPARIRAQARAFTLIELLTVIAIIGILAAILIPTVGKVRSMAKKTQCVSNLRQWGTAVRVFATENKGTVPLYNKSPEDWALYSPYFGQKHMINDEGVRRTSQVVMSRCPGTVKEDPNQERDYAFVRPTDANAAKNNKRGTDFGISDTNNIAVYNLNDVKSPSRLFLMVEVYTGHNNEYLLSAPTEFATTVRTMQFNTTAPGRVRHGGVANVVYLDGHVGALTLAQTNSGDPVARAALAASMLLAN